MKNIKKALLLGIAFLGVGAITACDNSNNNNGQQQVENDATKALDKILLNQDKGIVTANFEVVSTVKYNGTSYDVSWKADKDVISFVKNGSTTICKVGYLTNTSAEQKVTLTATVTVGDNIANRNFEVTVPKFVVNTIAEADEAAAKTNLNIRGIIVTKEAYNATAKTTNVYCKAFDGNGGFEAYTLSCTQEQYDNELVVGNTIYVAGPKAYYNGLRELSPTTYILDTNEAKKTVEAEDLTASVAAGTFKNDSSKQCHLAKFENVDIVSISTPDSTGQYSIIVGDESDKTKQATVRISKYFFAGKTATDYAFKDLGLVPAQKITVTGLVGWYNGAQLTPLAATDIVAGEVNYGKAVALTAANDLASAVGTKCIPNKVVTLKTKLADLGLKGDNYKDFTIEYTTESTVASIASGKLTNTKPEADTDVTVVVTVKKGTEVVATKNVTYKLLKEVTYTAHADYIKAKDKAEINVKGYVLEVSADKKTVFLQDDNGNTFYCYLSKALTATQATVGYQLGITGSMTTYNGLRELGSAVIVEDLGQTNKTLTYVNKTEDFTANGYTTLADADQCKAVTFTGVIKSVDGRNIVVTVGDKEIKVYLNNNSIVLTYPKAGDNVTINGLLGLYAKDDNKTYQILVNNADNFVVSVSDEEKATRELAALKATIGTATIELPKTVNCTPLFDGVTVTVALGDSATALSYDATNKVLTINPKTTQATETVTFTVTSGEVTKTEAVTITTKLNEKARLTDFSGNSSKSYSVGNAAVDVTKMGLSADEFEATGALNGKTKGDSVFINGTQLRLYNDSTNGNGTQITISVKSGEIASVQVVLASDSKAVTVLKDNEVVKAKNGSYEINGTSFTLKDAAKDGQVRITSIIIFLK